MSTLPGVGQISYNGFVFDGPHVNSSVEFSNVRSADDRTVIAQKFLIEIHCTIDTEHCNELMVAEDDDIDDTVTSKVLLSPVDKIRAMLSEDGQELIFESKIFNKLRINTTSSNRQRTDFIDIDFGPRVQRCVVSPLASNRAFEVIWSVETTIGYCPAFDGGEPTGEELTSWSLGDVKQICYSVEWSTDPRGYLTRKITGFLDVIGQASPSGSNIYNADEYRERLVFPLALGMSRSQTFSLSDRRDRLTFTFTDAEIESQHAYPPGVVDISVTQSTRIGRSTAYAQAVTTIEGHCEVANGLTTAHAWARVYAIIATRIAAARSHIPIFINDWKVDEQLFGRRVTFSLVYERTGHAPEGFLRSSAMFEPVDTSWEDWRDSMTGSYGPQSLRGVSNQEYDYTLDASASPCSPQPFGVSVTLPDALAKFPANPPSMLVFANLKPPPQHSYTYYRSQLISDVKPAAATFSEMPIYGGTYTPTEAKTSEGTVLAPGLNSYSFQGRGADPHSVAPMVELTLVGVASRVGYAVEIPSLSSQWTALVSKVPNGSKMIHETREVFGQQLHMTAWAIRYMVAESLVNAAADLGALTQQLFVIPSNPTGSQGKVE